MTHGFDREFWERHWREGRAGGPGSMAANPPNPYVARELAGLPPGTALDAGCGAGAEATWLAGRGWQVTGADLSAEALARADERATAQGLAGRVTWVEADLGAWEPGTSFDLVMTHYAHADLPQLDLYDRLATWVAPGGTLLIVGHRHGAAPGDGHDHGDGRSASEPPPEASASATAVAARLDPSTWDVVTADEPDRTLTDGPDGPLVLRDVVVRAVRRR